MNVKQLSEHIVKPVLMALGMFSGEAFLLLLGTAAQESGGFNFIRQLGNGPALGLWQMEPATHDDIVENYLRYRPELESKVLELAGVTEFNSRYLLINLAYACAFARLHYRRVKGAIPLSLDGQARYWKDHYNTHQGKGHPQEFIDNYQRYVAGKV